MTKAQIEKKYGVSIVDEGYYNYWGKYVRSYQIYSADGCRWDAGFGSIKSVEKECKEWESQLLAIKAQKEATA